MLRQFQHIWLCDVRNCDVQESSVTRWRNRANAGEQWDLNKGRAAMGLWKHEKRGTSYCCVLVNTLHFIYVQKHIDLRTLCAACCNGTMDTFPRSTYTRLFRIRDDSLPSASPARFCSEGTTASKKDIHPLEHTKMERMHWDRTVWMVWLIINSEGRLVNMNLYMINIAFTRKIHAQKVWYSMYM